MGEVSRQQRGRALELQIRQWVPFARPGRYVSWVGGSALVWSWDEDIVGAAMAEAGVASTAVRIIPESVLHDSKVGGVELARCMEGFEGKVWGEQGLIASRWWPIVPEASAWMQFQRDAGVSPEGVVADVPAPAELCLNDGPRGAASSLEAFAIPEQRERNLVALAALCLLAPTLWYGTQVSKYRLAIGELESELVELNSRSEPLVTAREKALQLRERVDSMQSMLERFPDQATLMAKAGEVLAKSGATLREWEFNGGRLKLQVATPGRTASSDFVKAFQADGTFRSVEALSSGDGGALVLTMEVTPQSELRRPTRQESRAQ